MSIFFFLFISIMKQVLERKLITLDGAGNGEHCTIVTGRLGENKRATTLPYHILLGEDRTQFAAVTIE